MGETMILFLSVKLRSLSGVNNLGVEASIGPSTAPICLLTESGQGNIFTCLFDAELNETEEECTNLQWETALAGLDFCFSDLDCCINGFEIDSHRNLVVSMTDRRSDTDPE